MKDKFKNYGLWLSLFALATMIAQDFFNITLDNTRVQLYVDTIMTTLILLGIISNPETENKWYKDDNKK